MARVARSLSPLFCGRGSVIIGFMNGIYAMYFTGAAGSGHAVFVMKDSVIVGADAIGGVLDGTFESNLGVIRRAATESSVTKREHIRGGRRRDQGNHQRAVEVVFGPEEEENEGKDGSKT